MIIMTCKDCVHYEACGGFIPTDLDQDVFDYCIKGTTDEIPDIDERCGSFKNKADFVEVKRGEWIKSIHKEIPIIKDGRLLEKEHEVFCCSVCDVKIVGLRNMSFCPFCGAKMDGERRCEE